jgi:hypothetical protein
MRVCGRLAPGWWPSELALLQILVRHEALLFKFGVDVA